MSFIIVHSGGTFSFGDRIAHNEVHLDDIATALAKQCRFNGHCKGYYSVAEHSILVSRLLEAEGLQMAGLLHDAHEAYVGDVVTPVKAQTRLHLVEAEIQETIHRRTGLSHLNFLTAEAHATIKRADQMALCIEFRTLFGRMPVDLMGVYSERWGKELPPKELQPECLDWQDARLAFIGRFTELSKERASA